MLEGAKHPGCRGIGGTAVNTFVGLMVVLSAGGCAPAEPSEQQYDQQVARSADGMVSSASALATEIGARIMADGGNAVDAAVATKFAINVALPSMASIGGRTQMVIHTAEGELVGIDGGTEVPSNFHPDGPQGYRTVGIPGTVSALYRAQQEYGALAWEEVVTPAARLAQEGFPMPADEAERHADVADRLERYHGTRQYYLKKDGSPYEAGEHFSHPTLARTLRLIAEGGKDAFYRGPIAEKIEEDMEASDGFLNRQELEGYEARKVEVHRGTYRGLDVYGTYRPASGTEIINILQILEQFDLSENVGSPAWVSIVGQAIRLGRAHRREEPDELVSMDFARALAEEIELPGPAPVPAETEASLTTGAGDGRVGENTTHVSTADRAGNAVAMTSSIGPSMGSRVASPDLGFLYAQTMHYVGTTPGSRPTTSMAPVIVTDEEGSPVYLLGGAGAARIISAIILSASRAMDEGLPLDEAVFAKRFHSLSDHAIRFEEHEDASWPDSIKDAVEALGFEVDTNERPDYFGRVHGIYFDAENDEFVGVADPRRAGTAAGPG